jgi:putative solute:sodium symporter small subunit
LPSAHFCQGWRSAADLSLKNTAGEATTMTERTQKPDAKGYWRDVLRLTLTLLAIWFLVSFGAGILFREFLDQFSIGGAPLGFWMAQNGAIYAFMVLIFYYCHAMARIERKYNIEG